MKIECPHCNKTYNIPDDRLPPKKRVSFPCPVCKGIIKLDLSEISAPHGDDRSMPSQVEEKKRIVYTVKSESNAPLKDKKLKYKILKKIKDLPPMPKVIMQVRQIMNNPKLSFKDIAQAIGTDQAISARTLKMANSAYYGLSRQVASIQQASVVLGYNTLNELITSAAASTLLGKTLKGYGISSNAMWRHSLAVAFGAKTIANKKNPVLENNAFLAGLIHDSGKLVLDPYIDEKKHYFQTCMKEFQNRSVLAEKQVLGIDHSEIASEICKKWKIPEEIATAIRYHHNPLKSKKNLLAYFIHAADYIAVLSEIKDDTGKQSFQPEEGVLEFIGIEKDIDDIMGSVVEYVDKITTDINSGK